MDLQGTSTVITGGASGIGAEIARQLAKCNAKVALLDTNQESLKQIAKEISSLSEGNLELSEGASALGIVTDVCSEASVNSALEQIIATHGPPRVCINCAGIIVASRLLGKTGVMPLADFERCIKVNLVGTFNVMRLAAAKMQELEPANEHGERGIIINTSSIAAIEGQIGQIAYSASKGGVASMTLPAARELAKFGIRVVAIAPGLIETPMLTSLPEAAQQALLNATVFPKRLGKAHEIAKFILNIIDNVLINGALLRLDGAVRLQAK